MAEAVLLSHGEAHRVAVAVDLGAQELLGGAGAFALDPEAARARLIHPDPAFECGFERFCIGIAQAQRNSALIGDNVMLICALSALKEANPGLTIDVAFVGDSFPLYAAAPSLNVHPYFLSEAAIGLPANYLVESKYRRKFNEPRRRRGRGAATAST